ncbi:MAG TPA: chloride channel protein [Holophagaceae bacterium]|nr:chloride channel protein [Geothrix sp.]HJW34139.1 chloride channel protein [Holophagaceae bacterium]
MAPSLAPALENARIPLEHAIVEGRVALISLLALALGVAAGYLAELLVRLIGLVTNLAYHHRFSTEFASPAGHHLGWPAIFIPVAGGILVGLMARYGSRAIRGHGIPEAMEQVLLNESRIPARITFLKPLSAAIAIGTGGPFGAEGPIIATGGALGSLLGQVLSTTALERKTLLAAGAAAGMAAIFAGASRAMLASAVFAFETTLQPLGLLPLMGGCSAAYLISALMMRNSIMTEKLARRGIRVPEEYSADFLDQVPVQDAASSPVVTLDASQPLGAARRWIEAGADGASHHGFPVVDGEGSVIGVLTRSDLLEAHTARLASSEVPKRTFRAG